MEWLTVKMPVEIYEEADPTDTEHWIIVERYEDSSEIQKAENELRIMRQGLKDLGKALFELKHPKK